MNKNPIETAKAYQSRCPACNKELIISEAQNGKTIKCPYKDCAKPFKVRIKIDTPEEEDELDL